MRLVPYLIFIILTWGWRGAIGQEMEMVKVPAGWFTMGHDNRGPDQRPAHRVYLDEFEIGRHEVTNAQYYEFWRSTGKNPAANFPDSIGNWPERALDNPQHPVVGISWLDAVAYAKWVGGRLPTEAEWEKASSGPVDRLWPWGNSPNPFANSWNGSDQYDNTIAPVGSYPQGKSYYGAMDMAGNVWEWTRDWYSDVYYSYSGNRNPTGPAAGSWRVIRGGSWIDDLNRCTTTMRLHLYPTLKLSFVGFRVIRSIELTNPLDQSDKPPVTIPPE